MAQSAEEVLDQHWKNVDIYNVKAEWELMSWTIFGIYVADVDIQTLHMNNSDVVAQKERLPEGREGTKTLKRVSSKLCH
jgi:hypothetical protein